MELVKNMQQETTINIENITRMMEIADIYEATKQTEKSQRYHRNIIRLCDQCPKNEIVLQLKIHSLNNLNKTYKSLETTKELLKLNPFNLLALLNIMTHLGSD